MAWNIRGVVNKATVHTLKNLVNQNRPSIVMLLEPKCSGDTASKAIQEMDFFFSIREEVVGFSDEGEKKGGARVDLHACRRFKGWIEICKLIDLGYTGSKFTWVGDIRDSMDRVFKRLDKAYSHVEWRIMFPEARI
ncbi:hypothetical protein Ahy_B03g066852 [Arachis hypogaea]|uniref:Endonuclease/exonuclease/phosphatase domain-containing protein n=1 Tax=Arachis hypogaea TaxID=3818 RepID=A0A445A5C3_ARAHY|nr:hypothetical protein Ahy_B03g066852 [Arachis hypogaea]